MPSRLSDLTGQRRYLLSEAAVDFFYLQSRSYPRLSALELTGNRYGLSHMERDLLRRGVFGRREALRRCAKQCSPDVWGKDCLVVDGHNVHITIESALLGRTLLKANDGAMRDLAGMSARFRLSETSERAMDLVFLFLRDFPPREVTFLFDAPMSHSGLMAGEYRRRIAELDLSGDARTAAVPEREFPYEECIVASSDHEVLDKSGRWLDLAWLVLDASGGVELTIDFSQIVSATVSDEHSP